jgi:hypothetical protein
VPISSPIVKISFEDCDTGNQFDFTKVFALLAFKPKFKAAKISYKKSYNFQVPWNVLVNGPTTAGILQKSLVKQASTTTGTDNLPDFSQHPNWLVKMEMVVNSAAEINTTVKATTTLKPVGDYWNDGIIGMSLFAMNGGVGKQMSYRSDTDWMFWVPLSNPIVEISFEDCENGNHLDFGAVSALLKFKPDYSNAAEKVPCTDLDLYSDSD